MSAFERYVSEVVEQESTEEVEERFCSSHGGFAASSGGSYPSAHQLRSFSEASLKGRGIETFATKSAWRKYSPAF